MASVIFREPNLAAKLKKGQTYEDVLHKLDWQGGIMISPKLDGIRTVVHPTLGAVSRTLNPIPNTTLRCRFTENHTALECLDGEFVYGDHESSSYKFRETFSKYSKEDDSVQELMTFHVFDTIIDRNMTAWQRFDHYNRQVEIVQADFPWLRAVPQHLVRTLEQALELEEHYLALGYEGVMGKHQHSKYKSGRSTWREQGLFAIKRFEDAEGIVTGFEEMMHNDNEATIDARGYTKRAGLAENKNPAGTLGKLHAVGHETSPFPGVDFKVGSGFNRALKDEIWANQEKYLGQVFTYKYQNHGIKDKPRAPIFKSWRNDI